MKGCIAKFFKDKQFGFIQGENGKEYFFHIDVLQDPSITPVVSMAVYFDARPSKRKPGAFEAYNVRFSDTKSGQVSSSSVSSTTKKDIAFPYTFVSRLSPSKGMPDKLHHKLNENCYDIAFEVEWTALTPVAANPCSDLSYKSNDDEHQGLDKRWLMIGNRLAISPFTIKSAIANGFANIMGSCYRVESGITSHQPNSDKFPYTGVWRRYRVSMSNSKPGILIDLNRDTGDVTIQPVEEYFYDKKEGRFEPKKPYDAIVVEENHKKIIKQFVKPTTNAVTVYYYGPYRFGMNLTFGPGDFNKNHYHRFYRKTGEPIKGKINILNLQDCDVQKKKVHMGIFHKFEQTAAYDHRQGYDEKPWHQDLSGLKPGDWVYYQAVKDDQGNDKVIAIGLNFQFKTAFNLHDDAIRPSQQECVDPQKCCPRCALFGLTSKIKDTSILGLKGRFKASTLIGPEVKEGESISYLVPGDESPKHVKLMRWVDTDNKEIAGQFLLPILGQPKANKRDVKNGYFDTETGYIRGAKQYFHITMDYEAFKREIKRVDRCKTLKDFYREQIDPVRQRAVANLEYIHSQRSYAVVLRENTRFTGVLGAENCSVDEIAALFVLLEHSECGHAFKIGLGKSLGLGSMISTIKRIWIRKSDDYEWQCISNTEISKHIKGIDENIKEFKKIAVAMMGNLNLKQVVLSFPPPSNNYWKQAK